LMHGALDEARTQVGCLYGARFLAEIYTPGCHWFPRLLT
jgi:hypothetical protein